LGSSGRLKDGWNIPAETLFAGMGVLGIFQ
jgi:hypothetical protein